MLKINNLCSYEDKNDIFLIEAVKLGDTDAFSALIERYSGIIEYNLSSFAMRVLRLNSWFDNTDKDDLFQECSIIFFKAIKHYDFNFNVKFSTYANVCIKNYLITLYKKYIKTNSCAFVSLDDVYTAHKLNAGGDMCVVYDTYSVSDSAGIFDKLNLDKKLTSVLTDYERKVFSLYMQDKSYKAMARILGKDVKSVDNAVSRIKSKLRKLKKQ